MPLALDPEIIGRWVVRAEREHARFHRPECPAVTGNAPVLADACTCGAAFVGMAREAIPALAAEVERLRLEFEARRIMAEARAYDAEHAKLAEAQVRARLRTVEGDWDHLRRQNNMLIEANARLKKGLAACATPPWDDAS